VSEGAGARTTARHRAHDVRRRRRILAAGAVVVVLVAVAWGVSMSPLLAVDTVQVRGTERLTAEAVEAAGGVHPGDAMLWIDPGDALDAIEALPYVSDARLVREWPDTVRITVRERRPVGWVEGPAGIALVDRAGRVLEIVDAAPVGTPQVIGAQLVPPPGGHVDARDAARVAAALAPLTAVGTASVEAGEGGVVMRLRDGPEIRLGPATRVGVKLRAAFAVLDASPGVPTSYVDVSVPTNPVAG
jgi:cell division protein FtsQ